MAIAAWLIQTAIGRAISAVLIGGLGWFGFAQYYQHKGAQKQVAKFEQAGKVNAAKSNKIRRAVNGLPESALNDSYRRD